MATFHFNLLNTWDIAVHHGHSAFRLLKIAYDLENEYLLNSEKRKSISRDKLEYLNVGAQIESLTTQMFRISSASIMMFQAMMEALINDSLERELYLSTVNKSGSFKSKWKKALEMLGQDSATFSKYFEDIYDKYRNPMVHPKPESLKSFNDISFLGILAGYSNGWDAYSKLSDGLGHPHDSDSWAIMCQAHGLPDTEITL